jgi:uncharacterized protein (TIGR02246 family)
MKTTILSLALCLLYSFSFAQSAADEKAVRAVIQTMDDAWNAHNYTYAGKYDIYHKDAVMINPVGMYWKNRAEIIQAHRVFGETMFKYETVKSWQVDIRFLAPTVAIATIRSKYLVEQDYHLPDGRKAGSKGDTKEVMVNAVVTRKNDSWKIASLQVTELNPMVQVHNPVKGQVSR